MSQTGILKFVGQAPKEAPNRGIRTFPHQSYGVSRQSPDYFHQKYSLVTPLGYQYVHEKAPQFQYRSQKKSNILFDPFPETVFAEQGLRGEANPCRFHLKKGRMGQFLDKNGWMGSVYMLSGKERSKEARNCSNLDRTRKIKSLQKTIQITNPVSTQIRIQSRFTRTPHEVMSEKIKIRSKRNFEAENRNQSINAQRALSERHKSQIEHQNVEFHLNRTTKQWYKKSRQDKIKRGFSTQNRLLGLEDPEKLEEWQSKTCRGKWSYKKAEQPNKI